MCRHLAYLGPPVTLADCVLHQPHSLVDQSWAPTDMRGGGTVNADGFGIGWLVGDQDDSAAGSKGSGACRASRYRRGRPVWLGASLVGFGGAVTPGGGLGAGAR